MASRKSKKTSKSANIEKYIFIGVALTLLVSFGLLVKREFSSSNELNIRERKSLSSDYENENETTVSE